MELSQLRYAVAVADEGTFTAAAAACFVSQPSLSQAVRSLEVELGVDLFARLGRITRLTPAGEAFVPAARAALRAVGTIREEVAAVTGLVAGHLDLVALPTLAANPVAGLLGQFRQAYPGVTVRLAHPDGAAEVIERLRSGESELGITELPAPEPFVSVPLGRQEYYAVRPPGSPTRRRNELAALALEPVITTPLGTSTRRLLDDALAAADLTAAIAVETDQRDAIVPLVIAGAGWALLPRPMAESAAQLGAVVHPVSPAISRTIGVVHRPGTPSPAARAFLDLLVPER
jgi:DNA-binding transcriptional LysR family regulator